MWDCHFSSASIITPRTRCSRACWTGLFPSVRLKVRGLRWCFCLVVSTMHFVLWGWITIRFWSHHLDTSFKPFWRNVWIDWRSLPQEWIELSSARRSQTTLSLVMLRGKSLIKMQNRSGPSTGPCGIPHSTLPSVEYCPFRITWRVLSCRQDVRKDVPRTFLVRLVCSLNNAG